MRSYLSKVIGTKCNVTVNRRKRSVVAGICTHGLLRALDEARFLLAWLTRHVQSAPAMAQDHARMPAAGAAWMAERPCSASPSRLGLGRPGSRRPSGTF
jgi:hypothetical protein